MKTVTWYALIGLLVAVALLPVLKAIGPVRVRSFEGFFDDAKCRGKNCNEGQFCQLGDCVQFFPNSNIDLGPSGGNESYF